MPSEEDIPSSPQDRPPENESDLIASEAPEDPEDLVDPNAPSEEDATPPDKLRLEADWVKCDTCSRVVKTAIKHRVTDTTWLMCGIFSAVGCVLGCCLIPFMCNYFKDVSHYCPRCKGKLQNVPRF
ncbi:lipopolysaccharide-induced tumor necrosis factor-alpha factor homolog [Engraulis encrasicolus]|uniref:lipopolysaccharide-induced tumor necrosis factor-alpha factor homolog n=1 Tax=Engraulis encrasicolus TaxID=184585 RepID=UPI002FCEA868